MKRIINNLPFKIISLILSLVLWLYVSGELERGLWWKIKKVTFSEIPIKIMGLPKKEFNVNIKPDKADVVLYSSKRDIESVNRDDIILFVNLSSLTPATYELSVKNIIPKDFNISKIEPSVVVVTIGKESVNPLVPDTLIEKTEEQDLFDYRF